MLTARDIDDAQAPSRSSCATAPSTTRSPQLANRALFYDRIEHALTRERARRPAVAVLFVDLDDFKLVNDRVGHAAATQLLVGVAQRLRGCLRSADTVARLGGDEFGVLLENMKSPKSRPRPPSGSSPRSPSRCALKGEPMSVPLSIGIAISAGGERSVDELLRRADLAMYAAKRDGKRRWELYDDELEQRRGGRRATSAARHGSAQRGAARGDRRRCSSARTRSRTVFQPIVDLRTGDAVGYEALARFNAPEPRAAERLVRPGAPLRARLRARGARHRGGARRAAAARRAPTSRST